MRAQARALARCAIAFTSVSREQTGAPSELPTHDLGHAVARMAVALDRLAEPWVTSPVDDPAERVLVGERPLTDAISVLLFGDLVLDCFARVELARRSRPEVSWTALVKLLDADPHDPIRPGVRYMNVALSFARDLLAEHYAADHFPTASFGGGGDVTIGRIAAADDTGEPYRTAVSLLRQALGMPRGPVESPAGEYHDLAWEAVERSPALSFQSAGLVRDAFRLGGAHSVPIPWIVDWLLFVLLFVLREHAKKRGIAAEL